MRELKNVKKNTKKSLKNSKKKEKQQERAASIALRKKLIDEARTARELKKIARDKEREVRAKEL